MLRDRIVCGVRSKNLQKQLLAKRELSLQDAEALAVAAETAEADAQKMSRESGPSEVHTLKGQQRMPPATRTSLHSPVGCERCGNANHSSNNCKWQKAKCFQCGKQGHSARKCRNPKSAKGQNNQLQAVESLDEDDDSLTTQIWNLITLKERKLVPPVRRTFTWGGIDLVMEIDTGSPVCVITREMYERHRKTWPRLQKPQVKLGCYMGSIPVIGELTMKVVYQSTNRTGYIDRRRLPRSMFVRTRLDSEIEST